MAKSPSELARGLASLRKKVPKTCERCGKEFVGLKQSRFCGRVCANAAYWAAHGEKYIAERKNRRQGEAE